MARLKQTRKRCDLKKKDLSVATYEKTFAARIKKNLSGAT